MAAERAALAILALAALLAGAAALAALSRARSRAADEPRDEDPRAGPLAAASVALARAAERHAAGERDAAWEARVRKLAKAVPPGRQPGSALAHFLQGGNADSWAARGRAIARLRRALAREPPQARYARWMDAVTRDLEEAAR